METQSYSSENNTVQGINRLKFHNKKKNKNKNKYNKTENKYNKPNNQDKSHLNLHIHKNQPPEQVRQGDENCENKQVRANVTQHLVIHKLDEKIQFNERLKSEIHTQAHQPVNNKPVVSTQAHQPVNDKPVVSTQAQPTFHNTPVIRTLVQQLVKNISAIPLQVEQPVADKMEVPAQYEQPVENKQEVPVQQTINNKPEKKISAPHISKILINQKLKDNFSVSEAKYDENCKCGKSNIAEVTFHDSRKKLYKNDKGLFLLMFEYVIVQVESGTDVGTITACGTEAMEKLRVNYHNEIPEYSIIKHAVGDDLEKVTNNNVDEFTAIEIARDMVVQLHLDMKITDAEWQLDRQRLTFYFTAQQRIDFRDLVKELAWVFKTRIELRQISTREDARRLGGMGPCGLNLCCSSFVNEFCHVTLDHARDQHLSNNVAKLSGYCGRLKCCLLYEHDIYVEVHEKFPPLHSKVITSDGVAVLKKIDVFKETAQLYFAQTGVYRYMKKEEIQKLMNDGKIIAPLEEEIKAKEKEIFCLEDFSLLESEF